MVLSREESFELIKSGLETLAYSISNSTRLNLNNSALHAENFFRDLLNLVFGWQLENANFGDQNAADIDLADPDQGIFIQVTARNDRAKIAGTLDSFHNKKENAGRRLKFMLISKDVLKYKAFTGHEGRFDPAEDIIDIQKLLKVINNFPTGRILKIEEFIKKEIKVTIPPPPRKFYPNNFIPDLKYFVGREELLANLKSTLEAHHKASIHDISGLGKTFACYKFADDNQDNYSKIFFVNCAKEAMMGRLASLGLMLDPSFEEATQEQQALAFKNWLETNDGWLAIYDNVDKPAVLAPFVPNNPDGDCIFTSNDPKIRNLGKEVSIDTLKTENAAKLLFRRSTADTKAEISFTGDSEENAFWRIVDDLDGLPVALNTTGAFIEEQGISYTEYLENLDAFPNLNLELSDEFDPYKKTVLKAFALAIEANTNLEDKFIGEAVDELYRTASLIAPDDIHEEFLRSFIEENEEFEASTEQNILWQKIRKQFQGFDLFKYDKDSKSFSTHRLVQKCIQSRLGGAKIEYCEKVLKLLEDFFPEYDYDNKAECERYYQHTLIALENAGNAEFEAEMSVTLYFRAARYQELLGSYGPAMEFYQENLERSGRVFGEEHERTATILNNLAGVYDEQGRYDEAIPKYEKVIEIYKKKFGDKHEWVATALNNLALVYDGQGKYDEAVELFKQAMEIDETTIGKEHRDYAARLNNLGTVYVNQGKYDEAIGLYKEAMEITLKALGKDHPFYAIRLNNLAGAYFQVEKYFEALPLVVEALRIFKAKLPPEHPNIAIAERGVEMCEEMLDREGSRESSESS